MTNHLIQPYSTLHTQSTPLSRTSTNELFINGSIPENGKYDAWTHPNGSAIEIPQVYHHACNDRDSYIYCTYVKKRMSVSHNHIRQWFLTNCSWKLSEALACQLFNNTYKNAALWQFTRMLLWAYHHDQLLVNKLTEKYSELISNQTNDMTVYNDVASKLIVSDVHVHNYNVAAGLHGSNTTTRILPEHLQQWCNFTLSLQLRIFVDDAVKQLTSESSTTRNGKQRLRPYNSNPATKCNNNDMIKRSRSSTPNLLSTNYNSNMYSIPSLHGSRSQSEHASINSPSSTDTTSLHRAYSTSSLLSDQPFTLDRYTPFSIDTNRSDSCPPTTLRNNQPINRPRSATGTVRPPLPLKLQLKSTMLNSQSKQPYSILNNAKELPQRSSSACASVELSAHERLPRIPEYEYNNNNITSATTSLQSNAYVLHDIMQPPNSSHNVQSHDYNTDIFNPLPTNSINHLKRHSLEYTDHMLSLDNNQIWSSPTLNKSSAMSSASPQYSNNSYFYASDLTDNEVNNINKTLQFSNNNEFSSI